LSDSPETTPAPAPAPAPHPLHLGVHWHPEHWPEDQWPLDIERLKEAGVSCVRLFESAWHRFEPREWEFDFEWAVRVLDQLRDAGLKVILATPTAAPPAWMSFKYPEILRVTPDGRRLTHGHPRPYSVVSSRYREFCTRVADQMVHAFRGHDAVIGWQIDDCINGADYGNEARRAFHGWLHERFGQIESLNSTWGTELGSQAYEYFEQVPLPTMARPHPSLAIAFRRFINDQWSSFIQIQCEVIRAGFETPISTNMTSDLAMNYFRQNHLIDRVGADLESADLATAAARFDRMRAEKPGVHYWVLGSPTENFAATTWLSLLSGGELHFLNHWREPWSGPDVNAPALVTATGQWSSDKEALQSLTQKVREQSQYLHDHPPVEARVAVVMSNESAWAFETCGAGVTPASFNYQKIWHEEFHNPIAQAHYWRDVIDQTADFCPYHVIIMPLLPILFRPTRQRLKEWVTEGGCLLIGPLTGHRTEEFTAWTDHEFGGLEELIGATCTGSFIAQNDTQMIWGTDPAPAAEGATQADPPAAPATHGELPASTPQGQCHAFTPTTAHVLARYQTQGQQGDAAILINKLGEGTVITLGARVDRESYLDLIHTLCELANIQSLASGSEQVAVIPRSNPDSSIAAYGVVNLSDQPQTISLPKIGTDRLTGKRIQEDLTLEPYEAMLVEVVAEPSAPSDEIENKPKARDSVLIVKGE
jgi:beta-galactosidase GanA